MSVDSEEKILDPGQYEVWEKLALLSQQLSHKPNLISKLWSAKHPAGLYIWGGVGRGKTMLMDRFFHGLGLTSKKRLHFHAFMTWIHEALQRYGGSAEPLKIIIKQFARSVRVLCLDELFVSDIADALLLGTIFEQLFVQHVTVILTSNRPPQELYRHGLQRERFLPVIALLNRTLQIVEIPRGVDYRLQVFSGNTVYFWPLTEESRAKQEKVFRALVDDFSAHQILTIYHRTLVARYEAPSGVVWFDFFVLCQTARSPMDYQELAKLYPTVFISEIPILGEALEDAAKRFIHWVDIAYDAHVLLVLSAAGPISELYQGKKWIFEFERTRSRLLEMQTPAYLNAPSLEA